MQILRTALTGERFSFDGRFHQVRDAMLAPRPVQAPLLPIRLAANSSQTLDWAGRLGLPVLVAAHVNPLPRLTEMLGGYRLARAEAGHPSSPEDITVLALVFTASTIGQVKADTTAGFGWLDEMATHFSAFDFDTMARTRGFVDTPEGVIERLQALRDTVGAGRVICWFNVGGLLPPDRVRAAMGLFAAEVMPALADRGNLDRPRTAAAPSPRDRSSNPARP